MATIALEHGLRQAELPSMNIVVALGTGPGNATKTSPSACSSIRRARFVTTVASSARMRPLQWPRRVIDLGLVPANGLMAGRATATSHFWCKLVSMDVCVAINARSLGNMKVHTRPRPSVAPTASHRRMQPGQRILCSPVRFPAEKRWKVPRDRVATFAFAARLGGKLAAMKIFMARHALVELELAVACVFGNLWTMAGRAGHLFVFPCKWIHRPCMRGQPDGTGKPQPKNGCMAACANPSKRRLVHHPVAGRTVAPPRWQGRVPLVVTLTTSNWRMARRQT
jgi:hypothetical protein